MPFTERGPVRLYYETYGEGDATPALLISGFALDCTGWYGQLLDVASTRPVILFDNRGAGASSKPTTPYDTREMALDAVAVLDAVGAPRAHVVGSSMGGLIAQEVAAVAPDRVRSLILASCYARQLGGPMSVSGADIEAMFGGRDLRTIVDFLAPLIVSDAWLTENDSWIELVCARLERHGWTFEGFAGQVAAQAKHDASPSLGAIRAPTLVVGGEIDLFLPQGSVEDLAAQIPGAELRMLEGASHSFQLEDPGLMNRIITGWCESH